MDYKIEQMNGFTVIGFEKMISEETAYRDCPAFWSEYQEKYMAPMLRRGRPENELERAVCDHHIGEFGVCVCNDDRTFRYLIAGSYQGGSVPEGLTLFSFPASKWAKFKAMGPMPQALQALNTAIFTKWMPENGDWELAVGANIEWYSMGDMSAADYESGIWVPVKRKRAQ